MKRRRFLQHLHTCALLTAWQRTFADPAPDAVASQAEAPLRWTHEPFSLGVASGVPRADSVVLWTRLAPQPQSPQGGMPDRAVAVHWEMAADMHFTQQRRTGVVWARADRAHSVHVKVVGLPAGRVWHYRFHAHGAVSPVGRTRTAPADHDMPTALRLLVASCQNYEAGHYAAHGDIAQQDADVLLFLGDYIYENRRRLGVVRRHETPVEPVTLEAYRRRYAHYKSDPLLQAAHAAHPWIVMWDDHEVQNDYAGLVSADRVSLAAFAQIRAAAYQAYFEHLPVDPTRAPVGPDMRLHDVWHWGRLADVWMLDERQFRSPQACDAQMGSGGGRLLLGCEAYRDSQRTMLGWQQEQWWAQTLAQSQARWQIVGHGTPMGPQFWQTLLGPVTVSDGWDGYDAARTRFLAELARHAHLNPVLFAGDVHRHMALDLRQQLGDHGVTPEAPILASEFVTSSISSRGLPQRWVEGIKNSHPDIHYACGDQRGYLRVTVDAQALHCEMRGTPHPVKAPEARLSTLARFVVTAGHRGLRRGSS